MQVPEAKVAKNRIHLDLIPSGDDQEREVNRLVSLGATVAEHQPPESAGLCWPTRRVRTNYILEMRYRGPVTGRTAWLAAEHGPNALRHCLGLSAIPAAADPPAP